MVEEYTVVTLIDGRRGYFYRSRFAGTPLFQPVDEDGLIAGIPELTDEEHEVDEFSPSDVTKVEWDAGAPSSDPEIEEDQ